MNHAAAFQDRNQTYHRVKESSVGVYDQQRVYLTGYNSPWAKAAEKRFHVLTSLQYGWDGYKGIPVPFSIAIFSLSLIDRLYTPCLPEPDIVPGSDGTVQIEWHINKFDIELDVLGVNNVIATRVNNNDDTFESYELKNNFALAWQWIQDLNNLSI